MTEYDAEVRIADNDVIVKFTDVYGNPVKSVNSPMVAKALREAAAEYRRKAETIGEKDIVRLYERNADRLEKELAKMGAQWGA